MTVQKAIDLLDNLVGMIEDNHNSDYDTALKMGKEAMENQIPKSPILEGEFFRFAHCPSCNNLIQFKQKYCPECGKAIDWEEGGTSD